MAKKLNRTEFLLEENAHFNYIDVNLQMSTVHVPTNVYDQCKTYTLTITIMVMIIMIIIIIMISAFL